MTGYHGGKYRHGKCISDIINKLYDDHKIHIKGYVEPFSGMCGVYRHVIKSLPTSLKYIASDNHQSLILMWQALQQGWKPPKTCSVAKYNKLKFNGGIPSAERGYIGFTCGFGGQFFCGNHRSTYGVKFIDNSENISQIAKTMSHVKFHNRDYTYYTPEKYKNYIFYCDPPYANKENSRYYNDDIKLQTFDSEKFWEWCREMSKYNLVIVSEYTAPDDFISIYKFNSKRFGSVNPDTNTESLFMYNKYNFIN